MGVLHARHIPIIMVVIFLLYCSPHDIAKGVPIAGIDFDTYKDGESSVEFLTGDTVYLMAFSDEEVNCSVSVKLIYPDGHEVDIFFLWKDVYINGSVPICRYDLALDDQAGNYAMSIMVRRLIDVPPQFEWLSKQSQIMIERLGYIAFKVKVRWLIPMATTYAAIFYLMSFNGAIMIEAIRRKSRMLMQLDPFNEPLLCMGTGTNSITGFLLSKVDLPISIMIVAAALLLYVIASMQLRRPMRPSNKDYKNYAKAIYDEGTKQALANRSGWEPKVLKLGDEGMRIEKLYYASFVALMISFAILFIQSIYCIRNEDQGGLANTYLFFIGHIALGIHLCVSEQKVFIPKSLSECITQLEGFLNQDQLEEMRNSGRATLWIEDWILTKWLKVVEIRHAYGYMEYKLERGPFDLAQYFWKMGVYNPYNMSSIIVKSLVSHLRHVEIDLDECVKDTLTESFKGFTPEEVKYDVVTKRKLKIARGALLQRADAIISVGKDSRSFGRKDFGEVAMCVTTYKFVFPIGPIDALYSLNFLAHFTIDYDASTDEYSIKDDRSVFGTLLNGEEIKEKGKQPLKNGDVISPAGMIPFNFIQGDSTFYVCERWKGG